MARPTFSSEREASDALAKSFQQCEAVCAVCETRTLNINRRRAGNKQAELVLGIAIAGDISRALDTINRPESNLALEAANVPDHLLRQLVLHWITGAV